MENKALNSRQIKLIELTQWESCHIEDLVEYFNVNIATIRRDIKAINQYIRSQGYRGNDIIVNNNRYVECLYDGDYASINYTSMLLNMSELSYLLNIVPERLNKDSKNEYLGIIYKIYARLSNRTKEIVVKDNLKDTYDKLVSDKKELYHPENRYVSGEPKDILLIKAQKDQAYVKATVMINGKKVKITSKVLPGRNDLYGVTYRDEYYEIRKNDFIEIERVNLHKKIDI
ncbi:MAG: DeoR family transcriptional regulator [Gammaproteobacteria bacterium]|nr:DeoR family transcriptional regulator [Gammaproteobacteria bacterium]